MAMSLSTVKKAIIDAQRLQLFRKMQKVQSATILALFGSLPSEEHDYVLGNWVQYLLTSKSLHIWAKAGKQLHICQ